MSASRLRRTVLSPVQIRRPFGPDPVQEDGSGLVGRILRNQATLEGALQDGLAEDRCPVQLAGEFRASGFRTPQLMGQPTNDMLLFPKRRKWNWEGSQEPSG